MGRTKIQIKKIETKIGRQVTYAKRRNGLLKKAYELSVLCGIDIVVVMFSPTGKLSQFCNADRVEDVIYRFTNTPQHERMQRKFENLEKLYNSIQKLAGDHRVEAQLNPLGGQYQLENQKLKAELQKLTTENELLLQRQQILQSWINTQSETYTPIQGLNSIQQVPNRDPVKIPEPNAFVENEATSSDFGDQNPSFSSQTMEIPDMPLWDVPAWDVLAWDGPSTSLQDQTVGTSVDGGPFSENLGTGPHTSW